MARVNPTKRMKSSETSPKHEEMLTDITIEDCLSISSDLPHKSPLAAEDAVTSYQGQLVTPKRDRDATSSEASVNTIIDSYDCAVVIQQNDKEYRYLVSRYALSLSSLILAEMLDSTAELPLSSTGYDPKYMIYLEGSPAAMQIVLQIIHHVAGDDLFDTDFHTFKDMAIICEKYHWQSAVRAWAHILVGKHVKNSLNPGYEDWLFITNVFSSNRNVDDLVEILGDECRNANQRERYIVRSSEKISTILWPTVLLDRVLVSRSTEISRLVSLLKTLLETLKSPTLCKKLCVYKECGALALGTLVRFMRRNGLEPLIYEGSGWAGSARDLRQILGKLTLDTLADAMRAHAESCTMEDVKFCFRAYVKAKGKDIEEDYEEADIFKEH